MASNSGGSFHACALAQNGVQSFATFFLQRLKEIHEENSLCDITVIVEGEEFKTHRLILAGVSDYFRAMFSHNMVEKRKDKIELHGLQVCGFKPLLEYAYSGELRLNMDNIWEILGVASFLQIQDAVEKCRNFLIANMDFTNAPDIIKLGEIHGLSELKETYDKLVLENFVEFSNTDTFLEMDHKELATYLKSDALRIQSEMVLLKAALRWYEHDSVKRRKQVFEVVEKIRYTQDGWPTIEFALEQELFKTCKRCKKLLEECVRFMQTPERNHLYHSYKTRVRYDRQTLIQIGGETEMIEIGPTGHTDNNYFHRDLKIWLPLGVVGVSEPKSHFATVVVNDNGILCGGYLYDEGIGTEMHVTNEMKALHCGNFALWDIPYMQEARAQHVAVHIKDCLFVVGGRSDDATLASVERFQLEKEVWDFRKPLPAPLYDHAGVGYREKVYISGGYEKNGLVNTLWCYDPEKNEWEVKTPMQTGRAGHTMTVLGDKLIVCGGWTGGGICLSSVEMYDPLKDRWSYLSPMRNECTHMSATVLEDKLYVAGGEDGIGNVISLIQEYDPGEKKWNIYGHLPHQLRDFGFCSLTVNLNHHIVDDEDWLAHDFEALMLADDEYSHDFDGYDYADWAEELL